MFSSKINISDVANTPIYIDNIKSAEKAIKKALLKIDFGYKTHLVIQKN